MKSNNAKPSQVIIDNKVNAYAATARAELARLEKLVASYEARADINNEASELATWADVNEIADLAYGLKSTFMHFRA
jgi:hypothetical protein